MRIACVFLLLPCLLTAQSAPLDTSFGLGGIVHFQQGSGTLIQTMELLPDGKILVSGSSNTGILLIRFNSDGSLDQDFGDNGVITMPVENTGYHDDLEILPDGKIISIGSLKDVSTPFQYRVFGLYRFHADGTLDSTFGQSGIVKTRIGNYAAPSFVKIQPDGKILLVGEANPGSGLRFAWARYYPDGRIDSTFSDNGIQTFPTGGSGLPTCMTILPDGKILTGGTEVVDGTRFLLTRLLPNGLIDSTFGVNGRFSYTSGNYFEVISDIAILPDGKIMAGGWTGPTTDGSFALLRIHSDGSIDAGFGSNGLLQIKLNHQNSFSAIDLLPNGKILASGIGSDSSSSSGGTLPYKAYVLRFHPNGTLDQTFTSTGIGTISTGFATGASFQTIQPDGKILLAGTYYPDSATVQIMLARILNQEVSASVTPVFLKHYSVAPNPSEGLATLLYELEQPATVSIKIYDMAGRLLQTVSGSKFRSAGEQMEQFDLSAFPKGFYRLAIESPDGTVSLLMVR